MDLTKIIEWFKLFSSYIVPVFIFTGFLLFAPDNFLDTLGLAAIELEYKPYIGGVFLFSGSMLVANSLTSIYKFGVGKLQKHKKNSNFQKRLHTLTDDEKLILVYYIENQTRTQFLSIEDGVVNELVSYKIIYRASDVGDLDRWAFNIQPWVWEYLNKHPELLSLKDKITARRKKMARQAMNRY